MNNEDCPVFSPSSKEVLFSIDENKEPKETFSVTSYAEYFENLRSPLSKAFKSDSNFERRKSCSATETRRYSDTPCNQFGGYINNDYEMKTSYEKINTSKINDNKARFTFDYDEDDKSTGFLSSKSSSSSLRKTIALNNLSNNTSLEVADIATMNNMELCTIDDLDTSEIPGYAPIPDNIPHWKKQHLERKNRTAINDYLKSKSEKENEKKKYGDIPQWKKDLLLKKEQQQIDQQKAMEREENKYGDIPQWKKDLLMKKQYNNNTQQ